MRPIDGDSATDRIVRWMNELDDFSYGVARMVLQRVTSEPTINSGEDCKACKHRGSKTACDGCVRSPYNDDHWEAK